MSNKVLFLTFLVPLLFLSGCHKIELYYAEVAYAEAIHTQEFQPVLTVLKKLAVLRPQNYESKLEAVEIAIIQFENAHKYLEKGDYYLAYIASHDSYRTIPTKQGKKILLKSGEKFRYVTEAQLDIVRSFDSLPKVISTIMEEYQQQPVLEWDLIEVNAVIGKLGKSAKAMRHSLTNIRRADDAVLFPQIENWKRDLLNQIAMIESIQKYLINIALYHSAIVLEDLNNQLTQDSIKLLSLVSNELAADTMRPNFLKAQRLYEPYADLTINLSLASSLSQRNSHAKWYNDWHAIEISVLEKEAVFSNYPITSVQRTKKLKEFFKKENLLMPDINKVEVDFNIFMKKHNAIYSLIDRLNKDRMLLNYG